MVSALAVRASRPAISSGGPLVWGDESDRDLVAVLFPVSVAAGSQVVESLFEVVRAQRSPEQHPNRVYYQPCDESRYPKHDYALGEGDG